MIPVCFGLKMEILGLLFTPFLTLAAAAFVSSRSPAHLPRRRRRGPGA